jgi:hypothetical protein
MNSGDEVNENTPLQRRRGAVDFSILDLEDQTRKRWNLANELRQQLIALDVQDGTNDDENLEKVRRAVREILEHYVAISADDRVRIERSLGRLRFSVRVGEQESNNV